MLMVNDLQHDSSITDVNIADFPVYACPRAITTSIVNAAVALRFGFRFVTITRFTPLAKVRANSSCSPC